MVRTRKEAVAEIVANTFLIQELESNKALGIDIDNAAIGAQYFEKHYEDAMLMLDDSFKSHLPNEQRAHDLALLAVQAEINRNLISQLNSGSKEVELDIYSLYFYSYNNALEAFSKDFPE